MDEENKDIVEIEDDVEEIIVEGTDTVKIANEAVATYAGIAVSQVQGVYEMSGTFSSIKEALGGKKKLDKGIKVEISDKTAKIDAYIIVEYGARIPDVAFEIQSGVKQSVENMTGLKVLEVNVHVQGVHTPTQNKEEKVEENSEENEETTNE